MKAKPGDMTGKTGHMKQGIACQAKQTETEVSEEKNMEIVRTNNISGDGIGRAPQRPSVWKDLLFLVLKIGAIVLVFALLFTFLFGIMRYPEPSMAPAIKDGDLVIFYRSAESGYQSRDVVVLNVYGQKQVRRVVAIAGDSVDITEDGLVINGSLQQELGIYQKTERYVEGVSFPLTVPEGQVFVLGDNRADATDSRIYGSVKTEDILGDVMTVIRRRNI